MKQSTPLHSRCPQQTGISVARIWAHASARKPMGVLGADCVFAPPAEELLTD